MDLVNRDQAPESALEHDRETGGTLIQFVTKEGSPGDRRESHRPGLRVGLLY